MKEFIEIKINNERHLVKLSEICNIRREEDMVSIIFTHHEGTLTLYSHNTDELDSIYNSIKGELL